MGFNHRCIFPKFSAPLWQNYKSVLQGLLRRKNGTDFLQHCNEYGGAQTYYSLLFVTVSLNKILHNTQKLQNCQHSHDIEMWIKQNTQTN